MRVLILVAMDMDMDGMDSDEGQCYGDIFQLIVRLGRRRRTRPRRAIIP
jgi:hypothetical protein